MQNLRAALILGSFVLFTLPLMPVQYAFLRLNLPWARSFPNWYHRQLCRLIGVRLHVRGNVPRCKPTLLIANHVSWLDIPVLSALTPLSFVAKREVASWPLFGSLARLQRTLFVDRERRGSVVDVTAYIAERLRNGDCIVLFAEGTSSDGGRVLPLKTSMLAAVKPGRRQPSQIDEKGLYVQTLAIAYTHQWGLPLGRAGRSHIAWYGGMELAGHMWELLRRGPIDVSVALGQPVALDAFADRKALANHAEAELRGIMTELLHR